MKAFTVATLVHCYGKTDYEILAPALRNKMLVGINNNRRMSNLFVEFQIFVGGTRLATCTAMNIWCLNMQHHCVWSSFVRHQTNIGGEPFTAMITLKGLPLNFHCRKWHRCVGDTRWALDFHNWSFFNFPIQELHSSCGISSKSWRTGLLLPLRQSSSRLLGVHGEGEGGTQGDSEGESLALASQSLAEGQALGCQRQLIFRSHTRHLFWRISELWNFWSKGHLLSLQLSSDHPCSPWNPSLVFYHLGETSTNGEHNLYDYTLCTCDRIFAHVEYCPTITLPSIKLSKPIMSINIFEVLITKVAKKWRCKT